MDKERALVRAVGSMGLMTLLSRIAGYVRDNLQAAILGAAGSSDAFVIAFRIPNMLRRLVGEGAVSAAFVPTFTRRMKDADPRAMWRFAGSILFALSILLAVVVVFGILFSPLLVRALAWGFSSSPDKFALTVQLNRWMFPYIFLVSLAALASGILNSFDRFALPAFTPLLLNLAIIAAALTLSSRFPDPAYAFAVGVLGGGILQLAVQVPAVLRHGLDLKLPRPFDREGLKEVGRLMIPRIFGAGITQINLVVDSQFAAALREGSVSFLYYAIRVTELTLGVFGVSLSTVILPRLSRAAARGDRREVAETLGIAVRLLAFVTVPASLGLWLLQVPIIHVLFERGEFSRDDTLFTASALGWYGSGLLGIAAVGVLSSAFYAHQDTRTPVQVGVLTFFVHLALNALLCGPMGHNGIALSTSVSAFVNAGLLVWLLHAKVERFLRGDVLISALRTCGASVLMVLALLLALQRIDVLALHGITIKALTLGALILLGAGVYMAASWLLRSSEVRLLSSMLRRR
jgi:putative peptidoglycan lipid II flippase